MSKEQADKLRTWVEPKQVEIHTLRQKIESAELQLKHNQENIDNGWFVKQTKKNILEAQSDYERKKEEFELEKLENDIKKGFLLRPTKMALEELKVKFKMAEDSLEAIQKAIVKAERNHDVKEVDGKKINVQVGEGNLNKQ